MAGKALEIFIVSGMNVGIDPDQGAVHSKIVSIGASGPAVEIAVQRILYGPDNMCHLVVTV